MSESVSVVEAPGGIRRLLLGLVLIAQTLARRPNRAFATVVVRVQLASGNEVVFFETRDPSATRSLGIAKEALSLSNNADQPGGDPSRN